MRELVDFDWALWSGRLISGPLGGYYGQTQMSDTGKHLEQFVKQIESLLVPQGFTVESRERVYNDEGIQIAEFDIVIEGKVGSAPFRMLIECRDRPSNGPAPASWIEQLVGRRTRFKFDKVVAVSTTGFASGAEDFASESGIELRSVETLSLDDIAAWFRFQVHARCGMLNHVDFGVRNDDAFQAVNKSLPKSSPVDAKALLLVHSGTGENVTIAAIWGKAFKANEGIFNDMSEGDVKQVTISVNYDDPSDKYQLETSEGLLPIDQMVFKAELSIARVPPSLVAQYSDTAGNSIAQSVRFVINTGEGSVEMDWYNLRA